MNKFCFLLFAALFACNTKNKPVEKTVQTATIVGLCSPLQLQPDTTTLFLGDYFLNPNAVDSLDFPLELQWQADADSAEIIKITGNLKMAYSYFSAFVGNQKFDVPIKRSAKKIVDFTFDPKGKTYKTVQVRGSFNAWNASANVLEFAEGRYKTKLALQPGSYEYLLVLDGKEQTDPNNKLKKANGQGKFNSVLDFEDTTAAPEMLQTLAYNDTVFAINVPRGDQQVLAFWQNQVLAPLHRGNDSLYYLIPKEAEALARSFVRIYSGTATQAGNDVLIPLQNRHVLADVANITRQDWEAASLYFLMIDRFVNGNTQNDSTVKDPDILPKANYYGGDIAGVTQTLANGYFDSLGMNTIWISPITQNPWDAWGLWDKGGVRTKFSGYHGYWPISNVVPDRRFATEAEVTQFLDAAHGRNKNVLLDYVANHVHQNHPIYKEHKDWATDLYLPDGTLNTERWDDHRLTTWFDTFMPTLDLRRPEIVAPMTDSAMVWIEKYNFDGFRHDATKHIDELYWRILTRKTKTRVMLPSGKRIFQIGETYGSPELINSYVGSGMLDAQFDFNLYDALVGTLANKNTDFKTVADQLNNSLNWYGHHHLMGNISGNQDRTRFISYASGDVKFSEDPKLAGWTRTIPKPNAEAYKKLALLHAFNFSVPGLPVVYYGDEYGSYGANDPDNRKMMQFVGLDSNEEKLITQVAFLAKKRNNNLALLYGTTEVLVYSKDVMIIHRAYFGQHVWMILNKGNTPVMIPFEVFELQKNNIIKTAMSPAGNIFLRTVKNEALFAVINPNAFGILESKKP